MGLLDFTSGNVDLGVVLPGGGTSSTSFRCVISDLSFRLHRDMHDRKTLCSGPWQARTPQNKGAVITATRQASKGAALSDPLILMSVTDPLALTFTGDTLCTLTMSAHCTDDGMGGIAGGGSFTGGLAFESYGAIISTWVIT